MSRPNPQVAVRCQIQRETEKAILIWIDDQEESFWIPLSQVTRIVRDGEGSMDATVHMSQWIADTKGIET